MRIFGRGDFSRRLTCEEGAWRYYETETVSGLMARQWVLFSSAMHARGRLRCRDRWFNVILILLQYEKHSLFDPSHVINLEMRQQGNNHFGLSSWSMERGKLMAYDRYYITFASTCP